MMERIHFTTRVLGAEAATRLLWKEVTQTLRAKDSSITEAILGGKVKVGDQVHIVLDDLLLGMAELSIWDRVGWAQLDIEDARRGGFSSLQELGLALKRAGYRFKPLDDYTFHRIQFQWLKEVYA